MEDGAGSYNYYSGKHIHEYIIDPLIMYTFCNHHPASPDSSSEKTVDEGLPLVTEGKSPTEHLTCESGHRLSNEVWDALFTTAIGIIKIRNFIHIHRIFDFRGKENRHWKLLRLLQKMMQIGHLKSRK